MYLLHLQKKYDRMGSKDKLIERFKLLPKDFTWDELKRLFSILGFELGNKGKTSGSRVIFGNGKARYIAHKPHPDKYIKGYVMKQVLDFLTKNGII